MEIRRFLPQDADAVSALIAHTLRTTNIRDYDAAYIENTIAHLSPADILTRAAWTHFYVAEEGGVIRGCGAIGPYWDKVDESSLFTIFVHPDWQGKGVGRAIIQTLERDEYFLRARRVEIPASITACEFYRKMGYDYKAGHDRLDEEGLYRMEKFR